MQNAYAEYSYIHNGKAGVSTAFEINDKAEIELLIPRAVGTTAAVIDVFAENCRDRICEIAGRWRGIKKNADSYIFEINSKDLGTGLYFLRPRLSLLGGELFGHRSEGKICFNTDQDTQSMMQLTLCDFKHAEPKKIRGGVIYHIFVDRFRRGGCVEVPDGARVIRGDWHIVAEYPEYPGAPLYNNTFYGGTLWGIIEKLDHIKSLGVSAIYLSPIFRAYSNHKYDTADYMTVDPIFGGEAAFLALVKACREKDIGLILDGVFNHTGSDSIYFNKYGRYQETGAYQSRRSKYFDWYSFEQFPNKYTSWWGIEILPRINPDKPSCREYFVGEEGVVAKYRDMGIYGFRLDVADELSDDFISRVKERLTENDKDTILYGEVWEDASNKCSYGKRRSYYQGAELDGVMNYPLRTGIIDYLLGRGCGSLTYAMTDVTYNAPSRVIHNQMNLLGTHDTERILTVLGGESAEGKTNAELARLRMDPAHRRVAIKKLMTAYTILATMPGIPTVFYGDEAGLEGYRDPFNRMPYPWKKKAEKLFEHYKTIGRIRRENQVYIEGEYRLLHIDESMLAFARLDGEFAFVTLVNNSEQDLELSFDREATELISGENGEAMTLSAGCAAIYKLPIDSYIEIN